MDHTAPQLSMFFVGEKEVGYLRSQSERNELWEWKELDKKRKTINKEWRMFV